MLFFWLALGLLTIMAIAMIVLPLRRMLNQESTATKDGKQDRHQDKGRGQKQYNLAIFQDRLAELETDLEDGRIDEAEYAELRDELEKGLLNDVPAKEKAATSKRTSATGVLMALGFIGLPALALTLYYLLGDYKGLNQAHWMEETRYLLAQEGDNMPAILNRLEQRLKEEPEHIEGWVLLGRSYMAMEKYKNAADAFSQVAALLEMEKQNPAVGYGLLAQAIYFANQAMTPGVESAVRKALAADPGESNALSILGVAAFQKGLYTDAARYWQAILDNNPNDPNAKAIQNGINRAQALAAAQQSELGQLSGQDQQPEKGSPAGEPVKLQVSVSLAEEVSSHADAGDVVYILARPANGGRMPVAVTRVRVQDLPLTLTLDDSMSMGPMAKLSSVEQVEIVARISKAGTPKPQSGDMEGLVGPVQVRGQDQPVQIKIDRLIP
ncbi:c-type cytochrome biogenesis protein CcmI [Hahella sp. CCB-MM4]|uniref:c-type cytochrome biogenesis protein CcmI n=1 Tax=Hahella sp. (strain CCB-MM4) TaxID=1926491 RepID=UPI000B9C688E|nr:c-type cytochrome biogenesis protein CcmI [Hahella sp. CCB-MM4]OZG71042.1 c-type cytochrome biogenesis protein CcmI [Hahella sp. CCB-MM4]